MRIEALRCIGDTAAEDPTCLTDKVIQKACERIKDKKVSYSLFCLLLSGCLFVSCVVHGVFFFYAVIVRYLPL